MTNEAVAVAAIVMSGVFLSVVAWQLLAIARTAVATAKRTEVDVVHRPGRAAPEQPRGGSRERVQ